MYCHFAETDKYQTNYDGYYGQYADNAVSGETYDQANAASEFQQHLLKYVQQYQDKQDALSILDDPSAVSTTNDKFSSLSPLSEPKAYFANLKSLLQLKMLHDKIFLPLGFHFFIPHPSTSGPQFTNHLI